MPTYDYKCVSCENVQEEFHGMNAILEVKCNSCGEKMKKVFSGGSGFILKGSGWPSQELKIKNDMTKKNAKAAEKTRERERAGEAVNSISDLK